jgi:hypothetical protein
VVVVVAAAAVVVVVVEVDTVVVSFGNNLFRIAYIFVDLQIIFHSEFVDICTIYLHTKFQIPSCNGSLVVAIISKAKYK